MSEELREQIARIIDPEAFRTVRDIAAEAGLDAANPPAGVVLFDPLDEPRKYFQPRCAEALTKADEIIALRTPDAERDAVLSSDDIFDMGYAWQQMLHGQTLEDARAVGRTLGCDLFDPIREELDDAERAEGFNPFQSSDLGIVAAKRIIKAALRALKGPKP